MNNSLTPSAQKVQNFLLELGCSNQVVEHTQTTRTSEDAANAIGCTVAQIAKSLIFKGKHSGKPVLVIASGINRVNEKKLAEYINEPVKKPDADFVRSHTGFAIGGIPPIGHASTIETFIDKDLLQLEEIWAAAGNSNAVFALKPEELVKMTGGIVVSIK